MDTLDPKRLSLSQSTFTPAIKQSNPQKTTVPRHQIGNGVRNLIIGMLSKPAVA